MKRCPTCGQVVDEMNGDAVRMAARGRGGVRSRGAVQADVFERRLAAQGVRRVPDRVTDVRRSHFGSDLAETPFRSAEFLQPARAADVASDVVVPVLQAAVTGAVVGLASIGPVAFWGQSWVWCVAAGGGSFAVTWLLLLKDHRRSLWSIERIEGLVDAVLGDEPEPERERPVLGVKLEVKEKREGRKSSYKIQELGIDEETLRKVARMVSNGIAFSTSGLSGSGKPLTRAQFEELRSFLIGAGYACWVNPKSRAAGVDLLATGRALFRRLAEE